MLKIIINPKIVSETKSLKSIMHYYQKHAIDLCFQKELERPIPGWYCLIYIRKSSIKRNLPKT